MYRTILVHCTSKQPLEDPRVLNALGALCEGSLKDPTYANVRFGLPNWFTAALLLWMTLMHGAMEGPAAAGGGQGSRNVGTEAPPAAGGDKQGQQQGEGKKGRGGPRLHREVFA